MQTSSHRLPADVMQNGFIRSVTISRLLLPPAADGSASEQGFMRPDSLNALFTPARCERDTEGIVGKWREGRYETDGVSTVVGEGQESQIAGRRELFEKRRDQRQSIPAARAG